MKNKNFKKMKTQNYRNMLVTNKCNSICILRASKSGNKEKKKRKGEKKEYVQI